MPGTGLLPFAFLAGAAACLNPCGFALLPAYVAYLVGREAGVGGLPAGVRAGAGMTVGVLLVFAAVGGVLSTVGYAVLRLVPLAAVVVGAAVALAGAAMLLRPSLALVLPVARPVPPHPGPVAGRTWRSVLLFGAGYGVVSLGCTLPIFLVVTTQALAAGGLLGGLAVFAAYGLGMGAVLLLLSTAVATGQRVVVGWLRGWTRHIRAAGALGMVAAGTYLVYLQVARGALLMGLGR